MTATTLIRENVRTTARPTRAGLVQRGLLACGVISFLAYLGTDIIGGLLYPGYSFTSQAISELMAVGAPSEAFVDPLFMLYNALVLAFAIGVVRAAEEERAPRMAGILLIVYALLSATGPLFFEMHQRGAGSLSSDTPHIILTALLVLLLLGAIGAGAVSLGRRFRRYSLGTLLIIVLCGVLAAPYGVRLAAGQSTPGFGIIERVNVYACFVWIAVFGIALLRRTRTSSIPRPLTLQGADLSNGRQR